MSADITQRVNDSLQLLADHLHQSRARVSGDTRLLNLAYEGLATFALGGKHLRSRLVHISAGKVHGPDHHAATVFGACVDLLHGAFLIQDDIIDQDDTRRGQPTIHAAVREEYGDAHLGISLGIVAGDLGINAALHLLLHSELDDALVRAGMRLLSAATQETITGEILDIAHGVGPTPGLAEVRLSNHLKTSEYSFGTPLKLGALAAGRDPAPMQPIADALGSAYQAADDIAGAIGDSTLTGKPGGGDLRHGRATLMTVRMAGQLPENPGDLDNIITAVIAEGDTHLAHARQLINHTDLPTGVQDGLHHVTDLIEGMLRTHV